jgi:hypothetical protein
MEHNNIVVSMVPALIDLGSPAPWAVLPPGIHATSVAEIGSRFANTPHRQWLLGGFVRVVEALRLAGCQTVYLDGSFTTGKPHPDDFDGCWDHNGMDLSLLDPVLRTFSNKREAQKKKYFGEMFPAFLENEPGITFLDFFQVEKFSGLRKGILLVSLGPQQGPTL